MAGKYADADQGKSKVARIEEDPRRWRATPQWNGNEQGEPLKQHQGAEADIDTPPPLFVAR